MERRNEIELSKGDTYEVRLYGMGTVGYEWTYTLDGESTAVEVLREIPHSDNIVQSPGDSVDSLFTIHAVHPGKIRIHFALRRPWEKDIPPLDKYDVEATIKNCK